MLFSVASNPIALAHDSAAKLLC